MAKRVLVAACRIGVIAVLVGAAVGFTSTRSGRPTAASVDAAFNALWAKYSTQLLGLCVGAVDGRVFRDECFGKKAPGSSVKPDVHSLFRIESVSKSFTATLLALRVQQGKVALTDPVGKYVPLLGGQPLYPPSLTLLDLADHYSGLPKYGPDAQNIDEFLLKTGRCLSKASCRNDLPGQSYLYSNWAVGVLGDVLGLHDGFSDGPVGPWEKDNEQAITIPLGMTDTRSWQEWTQSDPVGFVLHRTLSGKENPEASPYSNPAGGLYSSAHDMLLWLRYSMGIHGPAGLLAANHLLYEDTSNQRPIGSGRSIGLVWNILSGTGATCISKDGDGQGFHASVIFVEGQRRGVFVLVNNDPATSYRVMASELLNSLPAKSGSASPTCPTAAG